MTDVMPSELPEEDFHPSIARNAAVLSMASIFSRALGMVREIIIPHFYGATGLVSAYALAEFVAKILYDLLVGGMLSAALVPVLSDYRRRRALCGDVRPHHGPTHLWKPAHRCVDRSLSPTGAWR